jgi:chromosome transmission fidelity protein 18
MCLGQVLLWLKQWDSCVFGSHIRATCDDVLSALRRHTSTIQKNAINKNFFSKSKGGTVDMPLNTPSSNSEGLGHSFSKRSPADNTPEQKVGLALLCFDQKLSIKDIAGLPCWFPTVTDTLLMLQVLLLCGPPGLGKTTLAHVAARHCGYHVVEVCVMIIQYKQCVV